MPAFFFKCESCRERFELHFHMEDVEGRKGATCPDCGSPMKRDFAAENRTKQIAHPIFFAKYSASDFLPKEVIGAGPNSAEFRKFASESSSGKDGRWI